jgi:pantoate--beta-alanine ligase
MRRWRANLQRHGVTVGLVPTMGALHAGHRSLIRAARLSCDAVVVSLFVNPTQFDRPADFTRYPRRPAADRATCAREGVDVLFVPTADDVYPSGFETTVSVRQVTQRWEGRARPGHFEGVATVVTKLFNLVQPHRAFFGQKDYQQCVLIRRLVRDLNLPVRIEILPTVREADGVAISSRNVLLTPVQRRLAPTLHAALQAGCAVIQQGRRRASHVLRTMRARLPRRAIEVDYLAVCDPETLEPVEWIGGPVVLLGAVCLGEVRLLDNLLVRPSVSPSRR